MTERKDDLELKDLNQYTGTMEYHNVMGVNVTDGVAYIMQNGYSWFVTDAIAVIMFKPLNHEFLAIKLKVDASKIADMVITDGNEKVLYEQHYAFTYALRDLTLFYENGVLLLAREH